MPKETDSLLREVLQQEETAILQSWLDYQTSAPGFRTDRLNRNELQEQSRRFFALLPAAVNSGTTDIQAPSWSGVRQMLEELSRTRAQQGFSPSETALFVFSLKQPLFERIRARAGNDADQLASATWAINSLMDKLGLLTAETFQRRREEVIIRQQQELMELSTPVVTLWQGILALPIIGTLDSARTQVVMENLLQRVVESGASIAIIDITGVPTVDTVTAQHLLKTVAAARLMGADCIISGIRPQIAQTIVHLGVELGSVVTKATLADAFSVALKRLGLAVTRQQAPPRRREREADDTDVRPATELTED
jgi:rsbT co-antagonist protein RsbR